LPTSDEEFLHSFNGKPDIGLSVEVKFGGDILKKLTKVVDKTTMGLGYVAVAIILVIIVCVVINIIGRTLTVFTFGGMIEIVQYGMLVAMSMILARTTFAGQHVRVSLFTDMMPKKAKGITMLIEMLISMAIFGMAAYQCFLIIPDTIAMKRMTDFYSIPYYLVYLVLSLGLFTSALAFLYNGICALYENFTGKKEKKENTAEDGRP
jgi:TRAP-type C4-dicarboxylate transport system permease small subunit